MSCFSKFVMFVFYSVSSVLASDIRQASNANCSPNIANVKGPVNISCLGLTPEAQKVLNQLLHKINSMEAKLEAANTWAEKYHDLETRLAAEGENRILAQQARKRLEAGDLDGAARLEPLLQNNSSLREYYMTQPCTIWGLESMQMRLQDSRRVFLCCET